YMGTPLLTSQGEKIGVLSVMDDEPLREWETGELLIQVFAQRAGAELERLSAAKETEQLQSQLIQIQKMEAIGTLASGLAHDMNNAMGVVRGHLELINEYCAAPNSTAQEQFLKIKESTNSAHQASLQAQDVITQLLDFAKPKSGQKTTFTIQDAVSETISLFSSRSLESSTVNIIDARETYRVRGDKGQLQQVITNMLLNGLAAMPRGGTITVSYFTTYVKNPSFRNLNAKPGIYVQLAISDTGVGIPKEYLGRVFEPFFSTQPQKGGTGLGLSMAYTIVQQHSGWIEVESELGKGSTFTIFLPLAPENLGSEVTTLQEETSDSIILVIDDEPAVLDLTIQFLEQFGYETKGFTRPVEALDWFQANASRVCLAILDLKMPTMDGKECLNKIKEGKKDLDIVILSGEVEHSLQQEVLALGATKFFQKPLEYRLLIDWIDNKLGHEKRPDTRSA
ncbi:MAG: response regulator, partial [Bdellovibrionales bacterium]|nr:response regulator [Bdellovibrionales bacterium]